MPTGLEAPEHRLLVLIVGDAEASLEAYVRAVLAEQLGTESVDRSPLHPLRALSKLTLQSRRDFVGGLVGEGERADTRRVDADLLDEKPDSLDEAKRLT